MPILEGVLIGRRALNQIIATCKQFCLHYLMKVTSAFHLQLEEDSCSVLRYLSVTLVTLYPVRHDRYMIVKVHSYVKVVLLIPSTVL